MARRSAVRDALLMLPVVAALVMSGCSRPRRSGIRRAVAPAPASPAPLVGGGGAAASQGPWQEPRETEGGVVNEEQVRVAGRQRLGPKLCAALDKKFPGWLLWRDKVLQRCRVIVIRADSAGTSWRMLIVGPGDHIVQTFEALVPNFIKLAGLYDVDGDGERDALVRVYSGGVHCCTQCYYVRLGSHPEPLGGFDAGNADCGRPADLDNDGKLEFSATDDCFAYFEEAFADSPFLPFVYGYRNGRFVDLTPTLARRDLRRIIAERSADVRARARLGDMTAWYGAATLLGEGEKALVDIRAAVPPKLWRSFLKGMPERLERLRSRQRKLWTGYPPSDSLAM